MSSVYFYEWLSPRSGFEFRLEFFNGADVLNDWQNLIELPLGSISFDEMDLFDYGITPTNFSVSPVAKLKIFMQQLKDPIYDGFETIIFDPKRETTAAIYFEDINLPSSVKLKCGSIVHLYVKAHGKDAVLPIQWRRIKTFVHRDGIDEEDAWDIITDMVDFKIVDIHKFVLEQVNFSLLSTRFRSPYWDYTYNYDLYDIVSRVSAPAGSMNNPEILLNANHVLMQKAKENNQLFMFISYTDIKFYIQQFAKLIYQTLLYDFTADYDIFFPNPIFYKQLYDGSGGLGEQISITDLYRIMQIRKDTKIIDNGAPTGFNQVYDDVIIGGLYSDKDENSYNNMYKSAWDYLCDYYEMCSVKAIYGVNYIFYSPAEQFIMNAYDVMPLATTAKVSMKLNLLGKITSSLFDFNSGNNYNDISNFVENAPGNRNGKEVTLPIPENNMPSNVDTERFVRSANESWSDIAAPFMMDLQTKYHTNNVYYFDNPANIVLNNKYIPIRVHEFVKFPIAGTIFSPIYNQDVPLVDYSPYYRIDNTANNLLLHHEKLYHLIEKIQDSGLCLHGVAAKKLMELYGDKPEQFPSRNVEIELPFRDITDFLDDTWLDVNSFGGMDPTMKYWFDLKTLNNRVVNSTDQWLALSGHINFATETATLKLINIRERV